MELIEYYDLPKDVKTKFEKEAKIKAVNAYKEMGIDPSPYCIPMYVKNIIEDNYYYKEQGMYFYFRPHKI